jgi:hypothetical protein
MGAEGAHAEIAGGGAGAGAGRVAGALVGRGAEGSAC